MFNEMLMRDFGFRIYKHFVSAPESAEDERRDRDDHKDKARTKGCSKNEDSKTINDRIKTETTYSSLKELEESANSETVRDTKTMRVEDNKISIEFTQNSDKGQSPAADDGKVEDDVSCVDQVISAAINFLILLFINISMQNCVSNFIGSFIQSTIGMTYITENSRGNWI